MQLSRTGQQQYQPPLSNQGLFGVRGIFSTSVVPTTHLLRVEPSPSDTFLRVRGAPGWKPRDACCPIRAGLRLAFSAASWTYPSAELVHDLRRDELQMVEVMQVEDLKIDPAGTHICVLAHLVDNLVR
jgi:hypothetical protein